MTEALGRSGLSLAETHGLDSDSVLDAIHRHWLDRTGQGDGELIMSSFNQQMSSGTDETDDCVALFDGYVARVGAEQVNGDRSEYEAYLIGRQAVRSFIESNPSEATISTVLDIIKAAYEADGQHEAAQNGNGQPQFTSVQAPRIRRVKKEYRRQGLDEQELDKKKIEALGTAIHRISKLGELRAGLRKGTISLGEALSSPHVERVAIGDILIRVPGVGEVKCRAALKKVELAEETEIGTLTEEQKTQLGAMFPQKKHQPRTGQASPVSREQSMKALRRGNEVRIYRTNLRLKLATGDITAEELLNDPVGAGMKLRELLLKLPTRVGANPKSVRSKQLLDVILSETGLPGSKRCDQLTSRQRQMLLDRLAARYKPDTGTYTARQQYGVKPVILSQVI